MKNKSSKTTLASGLKDKIIGFLCNNMEIRELEAQLRIIEEEKQLNQELLNQMKNAKD